MQTTGSPPRISGSRRISRVVPGMSVDNGPFLAQQPVQKTGFAHIGASGQDDLQPFAQQAALRLRPDQRLQGGDQSRQGLN